MHVRFPHIETNSDHDSKTGDVILSRSPDSLRKIVDALYQLEIADDFLSQIEREQAQAVQERIEL